MIPLDADIQEEAQQDHLMLFREQRGGLVASLKTVVVIGRTKKAVAAYARVLMRESRMFSPEEIKSMTEHRVVCKPYAYDTRIDWETYLLTSDVKNMQVIGYCNKPLIPLVDAGECSNT